MEKLYYKPIQNYKILQVGRDPQGTLNPALKKLTHMGTEPWVQHHAVSVQSFPPTQGGQMSPCVFNNTFDLEASLQNMYPKICRQDFISHAPSLLKAQALMQPLTSGQGLVALGEQHIWRGAVVGWGAQDRAAATAHLQTS